MAISIVMFQSTPPCGGRQPSDRRRLTVSIHAPVRGATDCIRALSCFNPRPRAGGDAGKPFDVAGRLQVSIHAPVRGATPQRNTWHDQGWVSIHAPVRGATGTRIRQYGVSAMQFQSTPPCGGRHVNLADHTMQCSCFNPRPRAGGDCANCVTCDPLRMFQSTPPCGGRLGQLA